MSAAKDRIALLRSQPATPAASVLNAIDFVEVRTPSQTELDVHFLLSVPGSDVLGPAVSAANISGGEVVRSVRVHPIDPARDWALDADGKPVLTLFVDAPGDFSTYTLSLVTQSQVLDPYFDHVRFSFKAGCPATLDAEAEPERCPSVAGASPVIDYLAKDYAGFRAALLEFSALRYPEWQERSEADFGMLMVEALAALGDDLSYTQDRVAAEAHFDTATERRSLVRHARLVDYEPRPVTAARTLLVLQVGGDVNTVSAGLRVAAHSPDGTVVEFETGLGLRDAEAYPVAERWNAIRAYYWDEADRCLAADVDELWVEGGDLGLTRGQRLLIETDAGPAEPKIRQLVELTRDSSEGQRRDPLLDQVVSLLQFRSLDGARRSVDLADTRVGANLVPATQGVRRVERFQLPAASSTGVANAVVRTGPNGTPQYMYTLSGSPLAWLAPSGDASGIAQPEISLSQLVAGQRVTWSFERTLLDAKSESPSFTLDPVRYAPIARVGAQRAEFHEYDGDGGCTLRFGDGSFGQLPEATAVFEVRYRIGGGASGNVAADSITQFDPSQLGSGVQSVTNPFAAQGGADAETVESIRQLAPRAFQAKALRAVLPSDYSAAAEELPWVQRAGTTFRYTGSWLSVFNAVDPVGSTEVVPDRHVELIELLERRRLVGHEVHAPRPRFVALDFRIELCALPTAFRGDVAAAVLRALSAERFADGTTGFFHVDNSTFGKSVERSALESAIQRVPGVAGVTSIKVRRRGKSAGFTELGDALRVGLGEIARVDSDPSRPESGSVRVDVDGGK